MLPMLLTWWRRKTVLAEVVWRPTQDSLVKKGVWQGLTGPSQLAGGNLRSVCRGAPGTAEGSWRRTAFDQGMMMRMTASAGARPTALPCSFERTFGCAATRPTRVVR